MHDHERTDDNCHLHDYSDRAAARNERRTKIVVVLTAVTMAVEIAAGLIFGSMALLADGFHMLSHALALSLSAIAYVLSRRLARDPRFCFGTGKMGDLAGFTSALLLVGIALVMAWESVHRLVNPVSIAFDEALVVAVIGLFVNLASALILKEEHHHHEDPHEHEHHRDHNLRSAYVHVVTDALTSIFAIVALLCGRLWGWAFLDPVMGIAGAAVICVWAWGLLGQTSRVLLDMDTDGRLSGRVRDLLEAEFGAKVTDLHVWRVAPGRFSAMISLVPGPEGELRPEEYKKALEGYSQLVHVTVEVNPEG